MAELKTQPTVQSALAFIDGLGSDTQRAQCQALVRIMAKASGAAPVMWGKTIVGFGSHHYKYASGREGDWFIVGFAPRKNGLTLYLMDGFDCRAELLQELGRHKIGKSCLYLRSLDGIDIKVLGKLVTASVRRMRARGQ